MTKYAERTITIPSTGEPFTGRFPEAWSDTACTVMASKYMHEGTNETDAEEVFDRIVDTITKSGLEQGHLDEGASADGFREDLMDLLEDQKAAFNSPVWFNVGVKAARGHQPSAGNYVWDQDEPIEHDHPHDRPQASACFISSVEDSLEGIMDLAAREARIFKRGSGSGFNASPLRGKGEALSGGGTSSGLMSFLKMLDASAGAIKSGGTTRRAAKMVCLDADHPEIFEFIDWKRSEESKAKALIAAGYDGRFDGEAYGTVSGQNSNNSVRIPDSFFTTMDEGGKWFLQYRTSDGWESCDTLRLWNEICDAAVECADPGVQFDTTINKWHTCPMHGRIKASNPCSEYMFLDDTACNLASINLVKFLQYEDDFDWVSFRRAVRTLIIAMDILVDLASYPTKEIADNSHKFRPLGLGFANLGGLLTRMLIPYGSEEGRNLASRITAVMTAQAYLTSASLAQQLGPFGGFRTNRGDMLDVLEMHGRATNKIEDWPSIDPMTKEINALPSTLWANACQAVAEHGARNSQVTVLAPTGTIALLMDCDTTGIEPVFAHKAHKTLAGGGSMELWNKSVEVALGRLGKDSVEDVTGNRDVFATANELAPRDHLEMMAACQPFLSGAISKTVNCPEGTTAEQVGEIYREAHRLGLKAVAVYVDGSKGSQPLQAADKPTPAPSAPAPAPAPGDPPQTPAPSAPARKRLPPTRAGKCYALYIGGQKLFLHTGEYADGTLGEIFVQVAKQGSSVRGMVDAWAMAFSFSLQHGMPLEKLVNAYVHTQFEPAGPVKGHDHVKLCTSIPDAVVRILSADYLGDHRYSHLSAPEGHEGDDVPEGHAMTTGGICPECGGATQPNGACHYCPSCGWTGGCG